MAISPTFLDELRTRTTLSTVIAPSVKLIKAGREFKACCPFHQEKAPSFTVNDEKGFYHCFGCGAHGDAIRFLTDACGLPFIDAVRELAGKAGMEMPDAQNSIGLPAGLPKTELPTPAKKGGAKLSRSETVTVRLDPKLNYLCELAARAQRRTKSSFIEWAIADSLGSVALPEVTAYDDSSDVTLKEKASELWRVDEADRVAALALIAPALLTHEEQLIWRLIRENGLLWRGHYDTQDEWSWNVSEEKLIQDRLRDHWEVFKAVALGGLPKSKLPSWQKKKNAAFDTDLDDDVHS